VTFPFHLLLGMFETWLNPIIQNPTASHCTTYKDHAKHRPLALAGKCYVLSVCLESFTEKMSCACAWLQYAQVRQDLMPDLKKWDRYRARHGSGSSSSDSVSVMPTSFCCSTSYIADARVSDVRTGVPAQNRRLPGRNLAVVAYVLPARHH
jgi:hypothetical protein